MGLFQEEKTTSVWSTEFVLHKIIRMVLRFSCAGYATKRRCCPKVLDHGRHLSTVELFAIFTTSLAQSLEEQQPLLVGNKNLSLRRRNQHQAQHHALPRRLRNISSPDCSLNSTVYKVLASRTKFFFPASHRAQANRADGASRREAPRRSKSTVFFYTGSHMRVK